MIHGSAYLDQIRTALAGFWLPQVYHERVLKSRTRAYQFPKMPRNAKVEIHHTLLGIELKAGRIRMLCPDLATARYLSVFARVGCQTIAIPYDITQISRIADELESSWHRMVLLIDHLAEGRSERLRSKVQRKLIDETRAAISLLGAGSKFPEFNQSTRQRPRR